MADESVDENDVEDEIWTTNIKDILGAQIPSCSSSSTPYFFLFLSVSSAKPQSLFGYVAVMVLTVTVFLAEAIL